MASEKDLAPNSAKEDDGISMIDVLREEEELEADANAVLGGSDAQNCTYPLVILSKIDKMPSQPFWQAS